MSYSSGVFSINSAGQPVVTGTVISSTAFNALTADLATGLSTAMLKDGTQTITGNIPMSSYKFTGLAAGSAAGDSVRFEQLLGLGAIGTIGQYPAVNAAGTALAFVAGIQVLDRSAVAASGAADTAENTLATITVPANALGANGVLRITTLWTYTASTNLKTLRARFGGGSGQTYIAQVLQGATQAVARIGCEIANRNATNSQVGNQWGATNTGALNTITPHPTGSLDTTASQTILITGEKASAGETLTLESYIVEIMPK